MSVVCCLLSFYYHHLSFSHLHCYFKTLLQTFLILLVDSEFVDDHFNVVILVSIDFHALGHIHNLTIHTGIEIPLLADALEEFAVVSLTALHDGCQKENALAVVLFQKQVQHVFLGIFHHLLACLVTECLTCTGIEQSQIVIDFCYSTDRRTWVLVGGLLLDANDRGESANLIYIRAFHPSEEVTDISAEGLNVSSLTLSENRVKRQ